MVGSTISKAAERSRAFPESLARSESFTVVAELLKEDFLKKLGNERKVYVKEDGPVSYTHLTLPTRMVV